MKFTQIKSYELKFTTIPRSVDTLNEQILEYFKANQIGGWPTKSSILASYVDKVNKRILGESRELNQLEEFQKRISVLDQRQNIRIAIGSKLSILQFFPHTAQSLIEVTGSLVPRTIKEIHTNEYGNGIDSIEFTDGSTYPDKQFLDRGQGGGPLDGITTLFFSNKKSASEALLVATMSVTGKWKISSKNVQGQEEQRVNKNIQLDEVRMGMSDLDLFIESPEADGIKAGFEAEMCFRGLGESETDYDDAEEDWDQDESVYDIEDACNFFNDGDYNSRRDIQDLREAMQESWYEWLSEKMDNDWSDVAEEKVREYIEENDYNQDDEIDYYLTDNLGLSREEADEVLAVTSVKDEKYALFAEAKEHAEEVLEELVKQALEDYNRSYDYAREEWEENNRDDYEQRDWLNDIGVHSMSDILNEFRGHVRWPHYNYHESESGYSEHQAQKLADDLENALNVETYASSGYHSARRTATRWIFEPDSSLEADDGDMPVEIISPPMPLKECLQKIEEFFIWAEGHDAYTNNSTGFHVGVSLPHVDGRIDYVKLALFLGDKHVLEQFGRLGNYYCKSSFDKIKDTVHTDKIPHAFELMRKGLIELATKTLGQNGHGKYTSINLKNDYVEFRSMGDEYHQNVGGIIDTVKRYAYAMHIASRPDLHREEYAKKLYKMLDKSGEKDAIALFSQLASGALTKDELRKELITRNVGRGGTKGKKYWWRVSNPKHSHGQIEVVASNKSEAIERALEQDGYPSWVNTKNDVEAVVIKPFEEPPVKATAGEPQPAGAVGDVPPATQARGGFTGEWKVIDNNGRELYRFGGVGNSQADANRIAQQWVNTQRAQGNVIDAREIDVLPVMGNQ